VSTVGKQEERRYTYADYVTWGDETRFELIRGVPVAMAAPSPAHQAILLELSVQFGSFLKGKRCKAYPAPFDVLLFAGGDASDVVVQPDFSVVCDESKIDDRGCNGAPDLVIEILSPSSRLMDTELKKSLYWKAGVREYWFVDPQYQTLTAHIFGGDKLETKSYDKTAAVNVHVLEGCVINLADVFAV
jgi:Uma2 family endonuclease